VATRRYEQRLRAETAEQTRRRVLDAVAALLRAAPAEPLSVERAARAAGVARSTVYSIFGSRAGLFDALAADLLERSGYDRLLQAVAHSDAREHLRGGFRAGTHMLATDLELRRVLVSMARLDPDAASVRRGEEERARGVSRLARRLAAQDVLAPGVSVGQAADTLWLLTSFDSFDQLHTGRGLAVKEVADLLIATAERSLCVSA